MAQKYGIERTGRTMPCNVCGKLYTDNIDKSAKEITCPYCVMRGGIVKKNNSELKTINLKEKIMPTKQGRIKPTDFTSSFKKFVNGVEETITINQYKTWKEMVKEVFGVEVYEKNRHASMYLVYKKYLSKDNDPNLYLEKIGEDPAEVTRTPEPVIEKSVTAFGGVEVKEPELTTEPEVTEPKSTDHGFPVVPEATETEVTEPEPEVTEPEPEAILTESDVDADDNSVIPEPITEDMLPIIERDGEGNIIERDEEGNIRPETTEPEEATEPEVGDVNGSEIGGDTGIDADINENK